MEYEVFVIYIAALSVDLGDEVQPLKKAQIFHLKVDEAFTKVFSKDADFADVFSLKLVTKLSEYTGINDHTIEFVNDWQPLYGLINSLRPMELETLKAYIKNN